MSEVRERVEVRCVVPIHSIPQRGPETGNEHAADRRQCDVDHVVTDTTPVGVTRKVTTENAEPIGASRWRHGDIQTQLLGRRNPRGLRRPGTPVKKT